ncbi:MAG: hypothetical protein AAF361_02885 [Bacteroidota bacterium]
MKTYRAPLLLVVLLSFLTNCSESSDQNYLQIMNENVVFVDDDQSSYETGDYLWFNMDISTIQTEIRSEKTIDIFNLTEAKETFFGFSIYQVNGEEHSPLEFNRTAFLIDNGRLNVRSNDDLSSTDLLGVAFFEDGIYKMRVGIPLEDSGQYFIANSGLGSGDQGLTFNPTNGSDIQIDFTTKIRSSGDDGRFYFEVN